MKKQSIQKTHARMTALLRAATFSALVSMVTAWSNSVLAAPCVARPTTLCLNEQRFKVEVQWKTPQGTTGVGQAVPLTSDTGYFWFFDSANVELVVKVLDGRGINNHFWVFFGALSNVEYTMGVTDTVTGRVKTYFNPSGQFASVGDTEAFSADETVSSDYTIVEADDRPMFAGPWAPHPVTEATAVAQTLSTCAPTETSLCLNSGRFRVEVNWKANGATGTGKAIPLTSDTGYFWFFDSANVELVVKVLDARGFNQKFWVFYGALSNVEYEMTVTDTLTGNITTYVNPAGQFASAGDTAAFPTGYSVAVRLDESRAVSADIPVTGGTISATASDGSVFTLTIPSDALLSDATITMTPVAGIDGLPLSGGLAAAVDLQPTGLLLFDFATLTIAPAQAVPLSEEITFAWRGNGEEFFLFPPELDTSSIAMKVMHFSGYGVGRGTAADQAAQQQRVPASPHDAFDQILQELVSNQRRTQSKIGALSDDDYVSKLRMILLNDYTNVIKPMIELSKRNCSKMRAVTPFVSAWVRRLGVAGCCHHESFEARSLVAETLIWCYDQSFDRCVKGNLPEEVGAMLGYYRALKLIFNADVLVDQSKMERCARFELRFRSDMNTVVPLFHWDVRATVPIQVQPSSGRASGSAPLDMFMVEYVGPVTPQCSNTIESRSGVFLVHKLQIDLNYYEGGGPSPNPVWMEYDPGGASHTHTLSCPPAPPAVTFWDWRDIYGFGLTRWGGERYVGFGVTATRWTRVGGDVYARKTYQIPPPYSNSVTMVLKHTPQ